jgi:very-short-patch-repair endonuclease
MTRKPGVNIDGKSDVEEALAFQIHSVGLSMPKRQYLFHPVRKWQADFCWLDWMLMVEVDGGTWKNGRHTRGAGYAEDRIRDAEAVLLGWRVLRFTTDQVVDGTALKYIEAILRPEG